MRGRTRRPVQEYWPQAALTGGALLFASVGVLTSPEADGLGWLFGTWAGRAFLLGLALTAVGGFATFRREKRLWPLRRRVEELEGRVVERDRAVADLEDVIERASRDYFGQLKVELSRVLRETLGLGRTERISLYRHRNGSFQLLGRYSEDPVLDAKPIRTFYPEGQGVIGAAWRDGRAAEPELPDPATDGPEYFRRLEEDWGMDASTARTMTMMARSLVACAIKEPRGIENVAVCVVESAVVGTIKEEEVYEAMAGTAGERLHDFLERGKAFEPDPGYAIREDY